MYRKKSWRYLGFSQTHRDTQTYTRATYTALHLIPAIGRQKQANLCKSMSTRLDWSKQTSATSRGPISKQTYRKHNNKNPNHTQLKYSSGLGVGSVGKEVLAVQVWKPDPQNSYKNPDAVIPIWNPTLLWWLRRGDTSLKSASLSIWSSSRN